MDRLFAGLMALFLIAPAGIAEVSTARPMPGVTFERNVQTDPPLRFYVVTVDLTDPRIHLKVSRGGSDAPLAAPWETTLLPVSRMAQRDGLSVAVNGNFFAAKDALEILGRRVPYFVGNWARACGWAMSDGRLFSPSPLLRDWPSLVVNDRGQVRIGRFAQLPADAKQVVSGIRQIVTDGRITADPDSNLTSAGRPAPHTVAGIDRQGRTLLLLVVDGRRPDYSIGMDYHRMAEEMAARGAWNALVLDGGGSATLVMRDNQGTVSVVNRPSDGHDLAIPLSVERCVADALGVVIDGAVTRPSQP
ncbi:MAG: phosphodiester glycosidase family protein [Tepidisphaeraceae bacterium]|jgi:exopolysaccharide biosynthesis protein